MPYTGEIDEKQYEMIEHILSTELIALGVQTLLLIDLAGNIIISLNSGTARHDVYTLAALAAGNFGAVNKIAHIIGEADFSSLFHKGENESVHFCRVADELLLITIFGKNLSLGFVRLKVAEAVTKIKALL